MSGIEVKKEKLRIHIQANNDHLNNESNLAVLESLPPTVKALKALIAVAGGQWLPKTYEDDKPTYTIRVNTAGGREYAIIYIPDHPIWGDTWCIHAVLLMRLLRDTE